MPTRQKRPNSQQSQISRNSQSPLTQGSSREGCLLPQREPSQATTVLGDEKTATHTLSLINNENARLEPRVTFIHYPLEGRPRSSDTKELGYRIGKTEHIHADPQTSSHSPLQMFPTLHPHTNTSPPDFHSHSLTSRHQTPTHSVTPRSPSQPTHVTHLQVSMTHIR